MNTDSLRRSVYALLITIAIAAIIGRILAVVRVYEPNMHRADPGQTAASIVAPLEMLRRHSPRELLFGAAACRPAGTVPVLCPSPASPAGPETLRVTWYGHASALIEIEAIVVL